MSSKYRKIIALVEKYATLSEEELTPANIMPSSEDLGDTYLSLRRKLNAVISEIYSDILTLKHQKFDTKLLRVIVDDIIKIFNKRNPYEVKIVSREIIDYVLDNPIINLLEEDIKKHLFSHKIDFLPHAQLQQANLNGLTALKTLVKELSLNGK